MLFEFLIDPGMVAPKNTHADDGNGNRIGLWQEKFLALAGCRKQIVNRIPAKSICKTDSTVE